MDRVELLKKFVDKYTIHTLTPYFQEMIQEGIVEFNLIRDCIRTAIRKQLLSPSEIQAVDILQANLSLVKE